MTDSLRLTRAELRELTGTTRTAKQCAWLVQNGIPVVPDAMGRPVVLRAAIEAKLMPKAGGRAGKKTEPDLTALPGGRRAA